MAQASTTPLNEEIKFTQDEIIVSKTDIQGKLVYANDVFCRVAEMTTREVIGQPHNIIRHPDMPRVIFKLLWETIKEDNEIFAYVKNMSKTGKYYWVLAHVTPSYDAAGKIDGYHSNRRFPKPANITYIADLYQQLINEEQKHSSPKAGIAASQALLNKVLQDQKKTYSEFIWAMGK